MKKAPGQLPSQGRSSHGLTRAYGQLGSKSIQPKTKLSGVAYLRPTNVFLSYLGLFRAILLRARLANVRWVPLLSNELIE
jgi:hypothetical protein